MFSIVLMAALATACSPPTSPFVPTAGNSPVVSDDGDSSAASATVKTLLALKYTPTAGWIGTPYSVTPTLTYSGGSFTGTIASCALASAREVLVAGLSINSKTCAISGTPTAAGSGNYAVTAVTSLGTVTSAAFMIAIDKPSITYTNASYTIGQTTPLSMVPTLAPATGAMITSCASATLPANLTINNATCAITGVPAATGVYTVAATINGVSVASARFSITVLPTPTITYPPATTATFGAAGGLTAKPAFSPAGATIAKCAIVGSEALPPGITLDAQTCLISGNPTAYVTEAPYAVSALLDGVPVISPTFTLSVLEPVSFVFQDGLATQGPAAALTMIPKVTPAGSVLSNCQLASGTLPGGLSVGTVNGTCELTGSIWGHAGTGMNMVSATDAAGATVYSNLFMITILPPPTLNYDNATFTLGEAGTTLTIAPVTVPASSPTANCALAAGSVLPAGLTLNAKTCMISGTPAATDAATVYAITVDATVAGIAGIVSNAFNITLAVDPSKATATTMDFTYTLAAAINTSAGVFDSSGTLVRTLWSNVAQNKGTYTNTWDGKDDNGAKATSPSGQFTIKVLKSAVTYAWDGVIGSTEGAPGSKWTDTADIWDGLGYMPEQVRLAFVGGKAWVAPGYSEGTNNLFYFNPATPNQPMISNSGYQSINVQFQDIDTDGAYLYLPNAQVWFGENFVTKFDTDGNPAAFTQGTKISGAYSWNGIAMNGIDVAAANSPNSIAVQNSGSLLAVGYPAGNAVKFFNKTTGASAGTSISLLNPRSMGFTSAGLWVLSGAAVYLVTGPGTANAKSTPLAGLSNPVAIATNKTLDHVYVLDGGTSQQVKEFDQNHNLVRTYGDLGGYTDNNPTITNTRLMLDDTAVLGTSMNGLGVTATGIPSNEIISNWNAAARTFVLANTGTVAPAATSTTTGALFAVGAATFTGNLTAGSATVTNVTGTPLSNGSWIKVDPETNEVWFCDGGTAARILHLQPSGTSAMAYADQILFGQERYNLGIVHDDATRIFQSGIEYKINYAKPLQPGDPDPSVGGNGAWTMVRNWNVGIGGALGPTLSPWLTHYSIAYAMTLSNGRVYGYASSGDNIHHEIELPTSGTQPMRLTGNQNHATCNTSNGSAPGYCYDYGSYTIQPDGGIVSVANGSAGTATVTKAPLTGFDADGNPLRGTYAPVTTVTYDPGKQNGPAYSGWGMSIEYTPSTNGVFAFYSPGSNTKYDANGKLVTLSTGGPHLSGAKAGRSSYLFSTNREGCMVVADGHGTFPCGYGYGGHQGITSQTVGTNLFATYDGQYASFGNTNFHYSEDGLLIGQFNKMTATYPWWFESPSSSAQWWMGIARPATAAGNIAATRFVAYKGDIYMYMSTEAGYAPIQRWHISNLSSVAEIMATGALGTTITLK